MKDRQGYVLVYVPNHPRSNKAGCVHEHILVAEEALGKYLPAKSVVHHVDETKDNNSPTNLVICENVAYHNLLHQRLRALKASGNPNAVRCRYCKGYEDQDRITPSRYHTRCKNQKEKERKMKKKEEVMRLT